MKSQIRILLFISIVPLLSQSVGCANKKPRLDADWVQTIPLAGTFQVHRFNLDNGLRVLLVEDHSSPTFAYNTWFRVGSRDEQVERTGLAHLFEHMMFKETKNLPEGQFDKILEGAGAEGENAFTSRDYTAYVQELPSDKLDLIAKLEADRMVNLIVNEKAFKTETEVVQNERRFRNENSPDGIMYQELFGAAFTQHPYHWPVIGYQQDLERMSAADALAFYHAYYSPNHATIIVSGDVTPAQLRTAIEKHYSGLSAQTTPDHPIPAEPPQSAPRKKTLPLNIQVEKLLMGYHVPGVTHEDVPALNVLQAILAGGKSSRLHRALVETGIASNIEAGELEDKDPTLFLFSANMQKGRKATQAEAVILREIHRLTQELVPDQELKRAKNRLEFSFYESLNSNSERARFLGYYEAVANDFRLGITNQTKAMVITPQEIKGVAQRYFGPKNRTVITGVPK